MSDEPERKNDPAEAEKPEPGDTPADGEAVRADGVSEEEAFLASLGGGDIEVIGYSAADLAGVRIPDVAPPDDGEEEILLDDDFGDSSDLGTDRDQDLDSALEDQVEHAVLAGVSASEHEAAVERLREAEGRADELRDRLLRTTADFENFRKRIDRDRTEERRQASASLVLDLLSPLDNFDRALEQAASHPAPSEAYTSFIEGVRLIQGQLFAIMQRAGLEAVDTKGLFDPNVHEALMQEVTTEAPHLSILQVFEPGYRFQGRLLRPARVTVASNPEDTEGSAGTVMDGNGEGAAGLDVEGVAQEAAPRDGDVTPEPDGVDEGPETDAGPQPERD